AIAEKELPACEIDEADVPGAHRSTGYGDLRGRRENLIGRGGWHRSEKRRQGYCKTRRYLDTFRHRPLLGWFLIDAARPAARLSMRAKHVASCRRAEPSRCL